MSPDQWKKLEHLLFCGRLHRRNGPAGFGRLASTPFLTAATMIGHAEKAALGANFVRGPRLISPGGKCPPHFKTDPAVTQTSIVC